MVDHATNLRVLKRSRTKPQAGDIFAMGWVDGTFLFGRVIEADIDGFDRAPMPGSYLIYVYRYRAEVKEPDLSQLTPENLLLPPIFINKMPWARGYFENVAHVPLQARDELASYCFWDAALERFVDRFGEPLAREQHPAGDWGLHSYRTFDDEISDALGVERVPED